MTDLLKLIWRLGFAFQVRALLEAAENLVLRQQIIISDFLDLPVLLSAV